MAKNTSIETTFSRFTAVQSALAELVATEAKNAADSAAQSARLTAERQALNLTLAPLARWRERLELLATQRAHVVKKRDYAILANGRFEDDLRAYARAEHHPDNWHMVPLSSHENGRYADRTLLFLAGELASIDAEVSAINAEIAAFEKLHGIA